MRSADVNGYRNDESARKVLETTVQAVLGASAVELSRLVDRAEYCLVFSVADMVPALREYRITASASIVRRGGVNAFSMPIGDVLSLVSQEREARRWSYVDP